MLITQILVFNIFNTLKNVNVVKNYIYLYLKLKNQNISNFEI